MANVKNWLPEMSLSEHDWFDRCPKSVLFEIARQFAMRVGDNFTAESAFKVMHEEWDVLHANGIVPQRPAKVRTEESLLAKVHPDLRAAHSARQGSEP